ncbi:MAG: hypothetical protein HC886_21885 [Leptolyngbyaceae cyanobacterium SM1_1_3]|nr:hypothetical protein [Leptolyngbyaceae cyanobacterium SM1_1_3]
MPRQRSEASKHLDLYKLAVEKKRLEHELSGLEQRCRLINVRLTELSAQTQRLHKTPPQPPTQSPWPTSNVFLPRDTRLKNELNSGLDQPPDTLLLEY